MEEGKASMKPVLYLDVLGVLFVDRGGKPEPVAFAKEFIEGVKGSFELRFLTRLEEHEALRASRRLGVEIGFVPFRRALGKASAIDFREEFYWIDDDPTPADLLRLSDERRSERLIPVNRREGVTEATLKKLRTVVSERVQAQAT